MPEKISLEELYQQMKVSFNKIQKNGNGDPEVVGELIRSSSAFGYKLDHLQGIEALNPEMLIQIRANQPK